MNTKKINSQVQLYPHYPSVEAKLYLRKIFTKYLIKINSKIKMATFKEFFLMWMIMQQINKSRNIIVNFLKEKKLLFDIKKRIIILKILKARNDSAKKIQTNYNNHKLYLLVHIIAHHVSGCYTVSPSLNNISKINIKIFTNSENKAEYTIIPMEFCSIRKKFVLDIQKNKFNPNHKTLYFVFIYRGKNYYDPNYDITYLQGEKVNTINFEKLDKKLIGLGNTIYSPENMKNYRKFFSNIRKLSLENSDIYYKKEFKNRSPLKPKTIKSKKNLKLNMNKIRRNIFDTNDEENKNYERPNKTHMKMISYKGKNFLRHHSSDYNYIINDIKSLYNNTESNILQFSQRRRKISSILKNKIDKSGRTLSSNKNNITERNLSSSNSLKNVVSFGETNYCN